MLEGLKASLLSMNRGGGQEPAVATPDVQNRLSELMNQLDAGIAKSTAREAAKPGALAQAQQRETDPEPQATQAQRPLHVVNSVSVTLPPIEEPPSREELLPEGHDLAADAMSEALRVVALQRKAAEALAHEAGVLEDRLKEEARGVLAERECSVAREKADRAAAEAEQLMLVALQKCEIRTAAEAERKELEVLLAEKRAEAEAAQSKIEELERALREAKDILGQKHSTVALHEVRAKECADKESAAQSEEARAVERMEASNALRDAAQAEAVVAQERADALKQKLAAHPGTGGLEAIQSLAARISEQVKLMSSIKV